MSQHEAGKGSLPRKNRDDAAYRDNYDLIFRKKEKKMRVAYCSDLHLEFGDIVLENTQHATVLILAGDICVNVDLAPNDTHNLLGESSKSHRWHAFFQRCAEAFPVVLYIAGNHEHYHGDYATTITDLKRKLEYLPNLFILDKDSVEVDGVCFVGGTLWTDMNREDPSTLYGIRGVMNDFRVIKNSTELVSYKTFDEGGKPEFHKRVAKFAPEDSVVDHKQTLAAISDAAEGQARVVVLTHHTPSFKCCAPEYVNDGLTNGAYHSDLSEFILDRPQIKAWICGHTHDAYNFYIGDCNVLCNPRGYHKYEQRASVFKLEYFDV